MTDFRFWPYDVPEPAPGRIYGPVYYIGNLTVCTYLVETGGGLILVDTGYAREFEATAGRIRELGLKPGDVRMILITHWHEDHAGASSAFSGLSGAQVLIHEGDADILESGLFKKKPAVTPCRVSRRFRDGDVLNCGGVSFKVIHCPGQSPGSAVFLADVDGPDGTRRALFAGDATGFKCNPELFGLYGYPGADSDYRRSVEILKSLEFDLYLGGHPHQVVAEIRGDGNPFISRAEWIRMVESRHQKMEKFAASFSL